MTKLEIVHDVVRCKDCGFWSPPEKHDRGWGICAKSKSYYGEPDFRDSLMIAQDEEGYLALLMTKPEFGCVMGQIKEGSHDKT